MALVISVLTLAFYMGRAMLEASDQTSDCVIDVGDKFIPCPEDTLKPKGQLDPTDRINQLSEPHGVARPNSR